MLSNALLLILCLHLSFTSIGQKSYEQSLLECQTLGYLEGQQCMVGSAIPYFEAETIAEKEINSSTVKGKIVVFNFWFMACPPCIAELPGLNKVVEMYKDKSDIEFISFTLDSEDELLKYFFPNNSLSFEIISDAKNIIFDVFKIKWGFPTSMVVDKNGMIHLITSGGNTNEEEAIRNIIETLSNAIEECSKK
jgi:peroxiredoxin